LIAKREEIEQANQRRLDEYQQKIDEGKERVQELNERFGDWYYVISNDVYQKIHLSLDDIVKEKESEEDDSEEGAAASEGGNIGPPIEVQPQN